MKRSSLAVALYLLLTFSSGVAVGGFGFWVYTTRTVNAESHRPSPDEYRRRYLNEMQTRLKLTPDQMQKLVAILDATRTLYREVADKHRPEYDAIHQHQVEQVRSILNEEQQVEYAALRKEREERRKKHRPPF